MQIFVTKQNAYLRCKKEGFPQEAFNYRFSYYRGRFYFLVALFILMLGLELLLKSGVRASLPTGPGAGASVEAVALINPKAGTIAQGMSYDVPASATE